MIVTRLPGRFSWNATGVPIGVYFLQQQGHFPRIFFCNMICLSPRLCGAFFLMGGLFAALGAAV